MSAFKHWKTNGKVDSEDLAYKSHYHAVKTAETLLAEAKGECEASPLVRIGTNQYRTILLSAGQSLHITTILIGPGRCTLYFHKESLFDLDPKSMNCVNSIVDKFEITGPLASREDIRNREYDIQVVLAKLMLLPAVEVVKSKKINLVGPRAYQKDGEKEYTWDYSALKDKKREDPKRCLNYGAMK